MSLRQTQAVAAAVAVSLAGCSWISPPRRPDPSTGCSVDRPVIDSVVGVAGFIPLAYFASREREPLDDGHQGLAIDGNAIGTYVIGIPMAVVGLAYLGSAGYGYVKYAGCRKPGPPADPAMASRR